MTSQYYLPPTNIIFLLSLWSHQKFVLAYETHERDISQLCIECELCILLGWSLMFKALSVHSWYEIEYFFVKWRQGFACFKLQQLC